MEYKYCSKDNFEDFACGRVLYHKPGMTNFPVRLALELFGRCQNYLENKQQISIYDPCCGGGYLLTVIGMTNLNTICKIHGSDVSEEAVEMAKNNLSLLYEEGLNKRLLQLEGLYKQFNKTSHLEAVESTKRLFNIINSTSEKPSANIFQADILSKEPLINLGFKADIVITDIPYGELVSWQGSRDNAVDILLENLIPVLKSHSVVAVCSDKKQKINSPIFKRLEKQLIGKRKFEILAYRGNI